MMNNQIKPDINLYYNQSTSIDNYPSLIKTEPSSSKYYINMINHDQNHFDFEVYNKLYQNLYPVQYNKVNSCFSPHDFNIPKTSSFYKKNISNAYKNIQEFSLVDKNLSNLSLDKYKRMREKDNFRTINYDTENYINKFKINCTDSINDYRDTGKNLYITEDKEKNNDINANIKQHLKNKIILKKKMINYKKLEKKINKNIEKKNKSQQQLKEYKQKYYSINFNDDELNQRNNNGNGNGNNNILNDFLINKINISKKQSNKKLQREKGEDDIPNSRKIIKNKTTLEFNHNNRIDDNITSNFIQYLKKDNQKLLHINSIYKQLIDNFFYFVNQLSKKYSFNKDIKDIQYYLSNANHLSNVLIDLEQHLDKMIKSNDKTLPIKNNEEKENEADNDQELLNKSKFININLKETIKNLKIEKQYKTRNENKSNYLALNDKSVYSAKNIVNKTLQNNSLNLFNNIKEGNEQKNRIIKIKKKN